MASSSAAPTTLSHTIGSEYNTTGTEEYYWTNSTTDMSNYSDPVALTNIEDQLVTDAINSDGSLYYDGYGYDEEFWEDIVAHTFNYPYNSVGNATLSSDQLIVNKVLPLLLIIVGTLGNVITIAVLRRRCFKHPPANIYLGVLAVGDTLVLWTGLFRYWVLMVWDFDVRLLAATVCKFHVFIVYWSFQFVSWITVAVAVDRLMTVCFIVPAKFCCTRNRALSIIIAIAIVLLVLDAHVFFTVDIINVSRVNSEANAVYECVHHKKHSAFFTSVWPWMDAVAASFVPCMIVMACNLYIVAMLLHRKRQSTVTHNKVSTLTALLVLIGILFCGTTMPIAIYQSPVMYAHRKLNEINGLDEDDVLVANFTFTTLYLLACINSTFNFFIYCICSEVFRKELQRMLGRKNRVEPERNTSTVRLEPERNTSTVRPQTVELKESEVSRNGTHNC